MVQALWTGLTQRSKMTLVKPKSSYKYMPNVHIFNNFKKL